MSEIKHHKFKGLLITCALCITATSQAIDFIQSPELTVTESETLTNEVWVSAESITIDGAVNEDLFIMAGSTLKLRGNFSGDVWGTGDSITASGRFSDNVRLAGRMTQVSGRMDRSLIAGGNTVKIEPSAQIMKDLFCFGKNIISEGEITGNARIISQKSIVGGTIHGNVTLTSQNIVILPGTCIDGDLNYTAPKELVLSPSVKLTGTLNRILPAPPSRSILKPNLQTHFLFALAALIAGLTFCRIFPRYSTTALHVLRTSNGTGMLAGIAAFIAIPMLSFFMLFTLIGLPLSLLMFFFYLILLYLGRIIVALWIGSLILKRKTVSPRSPAGPLTVGLLVIYTLTSITVISLPIDILVLVTGLGAMLIALFTNPVLIIQKPKNMTTTQTEA